MAGKNGAHFYVNTDDFSLSSQELVNIAGFVFDLFDKFSAPAGSSFKPAFERAFLYKY